MVAMRGIRWFSLAAGRDTGGVSCGLDGVFVGGVGLLRRECRSERDTQWTVRPLAELNDELTGRYRLPIDVTAKAQALALIANALNRGDLAMGAIATVQMQFPDPPPLTKGVEAIDDIIRRASELYRSHLLKAGWDPTKHPRRGSPPNRGWFAPVEGDSDADAGAQNQQKPNISPKGWPSNRNRSAGLKWLEDVAEAIVEVGGRLFLRRTPIGLAVLAFVKTLAPQELNRGESPGIEGKQRLVDQMITSLDPPKTLEELQKRPTENVLGYDRHHIVEQNDFNLKKSTFVKFGKERIEDPDNITWVPRLRHEQITNFYNSRPARDDASTFRESIRDLDYEQQRAIGLQKMRDFGVLK